MKTTALDDWQKEMKTLFPGGSETVAFVCPACKNVATVGDFKAAGQSENAAPQQCFFRDADPKRCDWAAFGLFRGPRIIEMPDGEETPVFEFYAGPAESGNA